MTRDLGAIRIGVLVAVSLAAFQMAGAQPATPEPVVLAAADCTVAPRPDAELSALFATPPAAAIEAAFADIAAVIALEPAAFSLPAGAPVNATTAVAVSSVVREYYACIADGDFGAAAALTTDTWLVGLADITLVPAATAPAIAPTVTAATGSEGTPATDVTLGSTLTLCAPQALASGHVGLAATVTDGSGSVRYDYLLLREVAGRWLVDATVSGIPAAAGCA